MIEPSKRIIDNLKVVIIIIVVVVRSVEFVVCRYLDSDLADCYGL